MALLVQGTAFIGQLGFAIEGHLDRECISLAQDEKFFTLVKIGEKSSLRIFCSKPEENVNLDGSIREILQCEGNGLEHVVEISPLTRITKTSDSNGLWVITGERSFSFFAGAQEIMELNDALRAVQLDSSGEESSRRPGSIRDVLSLRFSRKRVSQAIQRTLGSVTASSSSTKPSPKQSIVENGTLQGILEDKTSREDFRQYLKFAFALENLEFFEAIERFESMGSDKPFEKMKLFSDIIRQFVEEGSEEQVNLPSRMSRKLRDLLFDLQNGKVHIETLPSDVFKESKREVYTLMDRNFTHPFVVSEREKEMRERLVAEMSGSFIKIWQQAGLDGYETLLEHFRPEIQKIGLLKEFFRALLEHINDQIVGMQSISAKFPVFRRIGSRADLPKERSLDRVMFQLFSGIAKSISVLMELSRDLNLHALLPIIELEKQVTESVSNIEKTHKDSIQEIEEARTELQDAILHETQVSMSALNMRAEISQSKKKPSKKVLAQVTAMEKQAEAAEKERESQELKVVQVEEKNADRMLSACEMLESLSLFRLEGERQILSQYVLAQRSYQSKLELGVQTLLFDCVDMDPIGEVVGISSTVLVLAKKKRTKTFGKRGQGNVLHAKLVSSEA